MFVCNRLLGIIGLAGACVSAQAIVFNVSFDFSSTSTPTGAFDYDVSTTAIVTGQSGDTLGVTFGTLSGTSHVHYLDATYTTFTSTMIDVELTDGGGNAIAGLGGSGNGNQNSGVAFSLAYGGEAHGTSGAFAGYAGAYDAALHGLFTGSTTAAGSGAATYNLVAVPEPAGLAVLALGLAGAALRRKR